MTNTSLKRDSLYSSRNHIEGLTTIGRATVIALRMNNAVIVATRKRWFSIGWHPPD
jgi:hypothetical protein